MRALGFEPRKEEIKKMVSEVDREATGRLSFDAFLGLMASKGLIETNGIVCRNNNYMLCMYYHHSSICTSTSRSHATGSKSFKDRKGNSIEFFRHRCLRKTPRRRY